MLAKRVDGLVNQSDVEHRNAGPRLE